MIEKFNRTIEAISPLGEKRTRATKTLDEAKRGPDAIKVLEAERDADVLTLQIEVYKSEAGLWRKQLRRLLFKGVEEPGGTLRFYLTDEVTVEAKTVVETGASRLATGRSRQIESFCPAVEKSYGLFLQACLLSLCPRSISTASCTFLVPMAAAPKNQ